MKIGVVGAGIQGCCSALALAENGFDVDLFDLADAPMTGASRWNEGKIHLGYVYANDKSMATAHAMIESACQFGRFFREIMGQPIPLSKLSSRFVYGVHRDSLIPADQIRSHFNAVDSILKQVLERENCDYLGETSGAASSSLAVEAHFNPACIEAAFSSPERSVDTHFVADLIANAIYSHPRISFFPGLEVEGLDHDKRGHFQLCCVEGRRHGRYKILVNTAWNGRLALDASLGYYPKEPWLHRYKLAVHLKRHAHVAGLPSCTFLLGPFGDLVNFGNGAYYLSWYPSCRIGISSSLLPTDNSGSMTGDALRTIAVTTQEALTGLVPGLAGLEIDFDRADVKGGHIFALGDSDIMHLSSQLHRRHRVGVFSDNGYHSIDTGKYGMAPMHARELVRRISR